MGFFQKFLINFIFQIFYPDLLEKHKTPAFTVTPCDDPDFAIIRFKAGPPYEDVAFKVVNREWEVGFAPFTFYNFLKRDLLCKLIQI